jgi:hypothetical protein
VVSILRVNRLAACLVLGYSSYKIGHSYPRESFPFIIRSHSHSVTFKLTWMGALWCTVPFVMLKHIHFCSPASRSHFNNWILECSLTEAGLNIK